MTAYEWFSTSLAENPRKQWEKGTVRGFAPWGSHLGSYYVIRSASGTSIGKNGGLARVVDATEVSRSGNFKRPGGGRNLKGTTFEGVG